MDYYVKGASGEPIVSRVTIRQGQITLHSRSGSSGSNPAGRNPGYVAAFDAIFDRLNIPTFAIESVLLDSTPSHAVPEGQRTLATRLDFENGVLSQVKNQIRKNMRNFGRSDGMPPNEGNQNKKIRIDTSLADDEIARRLRVVSIPIAGSKLPAALGGIRSEKSHILEEDLRKVKAEHIQKALSRLDIEGAAAGTGSSHDFDAKTAAGATYPPDRVFRLALEEALGVEVEPGAFRTGWGTLSFEILEKYGLWIAPRPGGAKRPAPPAGVIAEAIGSVSLTEEETIWIEGNPRIAVHLKKERQVGLARKKRDQFIADNGKLTCERCGLDPVHEYGPEAGQACIEVHHHRTHVADMEPGHETSLDDLKCLCSNCHRVLHRALALGLPFDVGGPASI